MASLLCVHPSGCTQTQSFNILLFAVAWEPLPICQLHVLFRKVRSPQGEVNIAHAAGDTQCMNDNNALFSWQKAICSYRCNRPVTRVLSEWNSVSFIASAGTAPAFFRRTLQVFSSPLELGNDGPDTCSRCGPACSTTLPL